MYISLLVLLVSNKHIKIMSELPIFISVLFGVIVMITIIWFYLATKSNTFLAVIISWLILQSVLGLKGFYQYTDAFPPRILLFGVLPTLIFMVIFFLTTKGRAFIQQINLKTITYFHSIRFGVEIVLALLFHYGVISVHQTFEGANFDILSGLSAPIIAYFSFRTVRENKKLLLIWNIICMFLLINIVIISILAFPSPFQQLSFDQPNIGVLYFPFNLLPTVVVPLVLFAHLIAIKRLVNK